MSARVTQYEIAQFFNKLGLNSQDQKTLATPVLIKQESSSITPKYVTRLSQNTEPLQNRR